MENNLKQQFRDWKQSHRNELPGVHVWTEGQFAEIYEKLSAIRELILCAQFLNKGESKESWCFSVLEETIELIEGDSFVTFNSQEEAWQTHKILGEELILKALQ